MQCMKSRHNYIFNIFDVSDTISLDDVEPEFEELKTRSDIRNKRSSFTRNKCVERRSRTT